MKNTNVIDFQTTHSIYHTTINLDKFVVEIHRIIINLDRFSTLENVQNSEEYKSILSMFKNSFEKMTFLGDKYNLFDDVYKVNGFIPFTKENQEQLFRTKNMFKIQPTFISVEKLNDLLKNNPYKSLALFEDLREISEQLSSYSDVMYLIENDLKLHFDYKYHHFYKICKYSKYLYR